MRSNASTNGHKRFARQTRLPHRNASNPAKPDSFAFCAADSERIGFIHRLKAPTHLTGLGTAGTAVVQRVMDLLWQELGGLPRSAGYLLIDAAKECADAHGSYFCSIGKDGAGTNPHNGRTLFRQHLGQITFTLSAQIEQLCSPNDDLLISEKSARSVTDFFIIAGSGGTSGGCLDEMITLIHQQAHRHGIREPRVQVIQIGPAMPLRDVSRQPKERQAVIIHNTYAENLLRLYASLDEDDRVWAIYNVDQSNGDHEFSRTEEMTAMLGLALYQLIFTEAHSHFMQRLCDAKGTGETTDSSTHSTEDADGFHAPHTI